MGAREVHAADSELVHSLLEDFRCTHQGRECVAKLHGEGKFSANLHESEMAKVLVEFLPAEEWRRPNGFVRWAAALRPAYLWFTWLPLLTVAFLLPAHAWSAETISRFALLAMAVTLLHLGCNLWNDFEDHMRGVDAPESSGGSGVVRRLWIPALHLRNAAAVFFGLGLVASVCLLPLVDWQEAGWQILGVGGVGIILAASFSGWPFHLKYLGLSEFVIFLLCGPLVTLAATLVLYPAGAGNVLRISLPLGGLAALRLFARNLQHLPLDHLAGTRTLATILGFRPALRLFRIFSLALFVAPASRWIFLVLPLSLFLEMRARKISGPLDPDLPRLRWFCGILHFAYGLVHCLSLRLTGVTL